MDRGFTRDTPIHSSKLNFQLLAVSYFTYILFYSQLYKSSEFFVATKSQEKNKSYDGKS